MNAKTRARATVAALRLRPSIAAFAVDKLSVAFEDAERETARALIERLDESAVFLREQKNPDAAISVEECAVLLREFEREWRMRP